YGRDSLILPGFIDSHVHYVQSPMIGSFGDTLLNWLNQYTFPTESKFKDKEFADTVARMFFRQLLENGTTTANVFSTTFATSVDAFFEESERYNTRMISGKVLQDRNVPPSLADNSAEESVELSERLLEKWHRRGRQLYAVIPRFAPTSTPRQLELAGELYQRHIGDGVYMHTHLDEAENEIAWVKSLFPEALNYADVYARFGLVGRRSVMAHCCVVEEDEWLVLSRNECGVVTCPSSNLFLGDAQFKFWEAKNPERPCRTGVGSDVGAGTSFSIPRQLGEAYKVGMLRMRPLDSLSSFYMATRGGAEALHLEDTIGSLSPGYEADITVIDLAPNEFMRWRMQYTDNIAEKLFVLQTVAPDNMCLATYVAGKKVYDRMRPVPYMYAKDV
ncbi:MAG: guanine deaminase, partial [Muribaculaceae bacterium]|nr:guanine deaminase [Muribaculaceae bacterium]